MQNFSQDDSKKKTKPVLPLIYWGNPLNGILYRTCVAYALY